MLFNNSHIRTKLIQHTTFFPIAQAFLSIFQKNIFLIVFSLRFLYCRHKKKAPEHALTPFFHNKISAVLFCQPILGKYHHTNIRQKHLA